MTRIYMKGLILLSVIGSMGLSSCGVINKKYKLPEVDTEKLYRDMNPNDTTTIASIPWKEFFTDPYLQALIDEGLENNYDMQIVLQRVKQAEAALGMAKAAFLPSLAVVGNAKLDRTSIDAKKFAMGQPTEEKTFGYGTPSYQLGLAASWELDIWGKLNSQKKARYAQYLNSQEGKRLVQTNLVAGIATMYYTLLSLDEQLKTSKEAIELLTETVATMEAMKEAGLVNGAAVEQTKAALYSTQVNIPNLEKGIAELENSMSFTLGRKPCTIARGTFVNQNMTKDLKIGTPLQLLANRPDVRSAELAFRSAFEMTNAAQASFYPSISLTSGMIGYVSMVDKFFDPKNLALSIAGGLTQPLFAKKQLTTQLKVAKAEQEIALLSFKKAILDAGGEVSNILYAYDASLRKNEYRTKQVESLNKSVEYTQLLLKAGEANYLEVITAEQNLLQAQMGQINDKLEQLQCGVDLFKALGGGVK